MEEDELGLEFSVDYDSQRSSRRRSANHKERHTRVWRRIRYNQLKKLVFNLTRFVLEFVFGWAPIL